MHETAAAGPWGVADGWGDCTNRDDGYFCCGCERMRAFRRADTHIHHPLQDASGHGATLSSAVGTAMPADRGAPCVGTSIARCFVQSESR